MAIENWSGLMEYFSESDTAQVGADVLTHLWLFTLLYISFSVLHKLALLKMLFAFPGYDDNTTCMHTLQMWSCMWTVSGLTIKMNLSIHDMGKWTEL